MGVEHRVGQEGTGATQCGRDECRGAVGQSVHAGQGLAGLGKEGPNQGHVLAKVAGKATGEHAEQFAKSSINQMRIDVIDAKTIAMNDPKKGRLVYTKE